MKDILKLLLFLSVTFSQGVNDKNFKEKINGGVVVAVFTSDLETSPRLLYSLMEVKKKLGKQIWMVKWIVLLKKLKVR